MIFIFFSKIFSLLILVTVREARRGIFIVLTGKKLISPIIKYDVTESEASGAIFMVLVPNFLLKKFKLVAFGKMQASTFLPKIITPPIYIIFRRSFFIFSKFIKFLVWGGREGRFSHIWKSLFSFFNFYCLMLTYQLVVYWRLQKGENSDLIFCWFFQHYLFVILVLYQIFLTSIQQLVVLCNQQELIELIFQPCNVKLWMMAFLVKAMKNGTES
eukprot:TRINITY_DN4498_c0_g3_i2.p1 TRINITY_DN4498_c0_g3~~TRINITY_DN4498_c0_g3_i2.p1  ORF type:complete len:215 (+),score=9.81 TRINITY_DN4498_c0_g3_i2:1055-1699(+)